MFDIVKIQNISLPLGRVKSLLKGQRQINQRGHRRLASSHLSAHLL